MAEETKLTKLKLQKVKVVFFNDDPESDFGMSITVDCTDPAVEKQITDWVKENNIGKDNPGVANIKPYTFDDGTETHQYNIKINDYTKYAGINGLGKEDIGRGAIVDLIANAYPYNNKFTGGKTRIGQSASAIVVRSGATSASGEEDLAELLGDLGEEPDEEVKVDAVPF